MRTNFTSLVGTTFALSHNWEIQIEEGPMEDVTLFATSVKIQGVNVMEKTWTVGHQEIRIPSGITLPQLTITFIDKESLYYLYWFKSWFNVGVTEYSPCMDSPHDNSKWISVANYASDGSVVALTRYEVFPYGNIVEDYDSEGKLFTFTVNLRVINIK